MNEEKKYSIIGRVEIGTDEYRDLIESVKEAEKNYSDTLSRLWKEQERADKAEKERNIFKNERDKYFAFINSSEEIKTKYKLFLAEEKINEMEDNKL